MGAIVVGFGLIGFLVLFTYLNFPPAHAPKKLVTIYDRMVLGVCIFLCGAFFMNARISFDLPPELRLPVAIAGALAIEIVFLFVCFLMRNFWIFKPPRRPGGTGFGF